MTQNPLPDGQREPQNALRGVVGSRIVDVRYLVAAGGKWWRDRSGDDLVHEVDHGVEFVMADGSELALHWEMRGENEFLAIVPGSVSGSWPDGLIEAVSVSNAPEWMGNLGRTVTGVGVAWHIPNAGCPKSVWAIRIDVDGGSSFVIALGEVREGIPAYLPDGIVVLFDRHAAESYRDTGSGTSAWGETVATS